MNIQTISKPQTALEYTIPIIDYYFKTRQGDANKSPQLERAY